MALPSIPTSFVPHPTPSGSQKYRASMLGAFGIVGYIVFGVALAAAIAVFAYDRILIAQNASKDAQLVKAEKQVDPATVEQFIRLRDRLNSSSKLLDNHIALSGFFRLLEKTMPTTARFTSLSLNASGLTVTVQGAGTANSFNAIAATSQAFGKDGRIKNAIFSQMEVNRQGDVNFNFSATLDPTLVTYDPNAYSGTSVGMPGGTATSTAAAPSAATATSTASTTP